MTGARVSRGAIAVACAFAALSPAAAAAEPAFRPPSTLMVAFNDGCDWPLGSLDNLPDDLAARGWRAFEPEAESPLGRHLAAVRPDAVPPRFLSFRNEVQGRPVYLVMSENRDAPDRVRRTCSLIDFEAREPIGLADLVPWAGMQPTADIGGYGEPVWGHVWQPGLSEGHERTEVYFVPEGSPLRTTYHIGGMIFTATRTETVTP